jgi:hypothetical protein
MKSLIWAIVGTLLIVGTASAGPFGPPEPLNDTGKFSLGLGYWFDKSKMELSDDHLSSKSNQYYVLGNYTFLKDWEVYGKLGGADEKMHSSDTWQRFSDGAEIFGTLGFKNMFYGNGNFGVGAFVEGSWYGDHRGVTTNQWDANFGISGQYKMLMGNRKVTLYGGPFAYVHQADSDMALNPAVPQDDLKSRHNVGGFLGLQIPVIKQVFFTAEAQMKDRLSGGASLSYKF